MGQPPLLEARHLKKSFPIRAGLLRKEIGAVQAVNDISFTLAQGELLGIVGESGSGKSTLARTAIRLIEPTEGSLYFKGEELLSFSGEKLSAFRQKVQMVFQDPYSSLNPRKPVGESVGEALIYHRLVANKREWRDKVAAIFEQVGLQPDTMGRYPHQFSGGQQQRLCIGRAIAPSPQLIVCDEAVSALDVSVRAQILNLFSDLKLSMGLSYLFISHDLTVVRYLCDRIIVLYLGKVMESASTEELFTNPKHPYTRSLLSAEPKEHPSGKRNRMRLKGEIPSAAHPPSGCPFRTRCPFARPECAEPPPVKKLYDPVTGEESHTYACILD